jgi:hypothetical protein
MVAASTAKIRDINTAGVMMRCNMPYCPCAVAS